MKIKSSVFEMSAPNLRACPPPALPEFAFIGRSNVGKSSLINLLAERRELAKVSGTPGKTKLINFFLINESWRLVDLPGYGFAKSAKEERADFNEAVADYIEHRPSLVRVFVLIDSRLPPQKIDLHFLNWLATMTDAAFALIFTKTDKQSAAQTRTKIGELTKTLTGFGIPVPEIFTCSAVTKQGRTEILNSIAQDLAEK
jgi:GTP-binding protein